ncbi:MAG: hypothetical protein Kow0056_08090 [Coriobacteriia bacterium]
MKNPAGAECAFYYEDMHRGRELQECRAARAPEAGRWKPEECASCPVPGILAANGSPHLSLTITRTRGFLGLGARTVVVARCTKHQTAIPDPHVGCPACAEEMLAELLDGDSTEGEDDV